MKLLRDFYEPKEGQYKEKIVGGNDQVVYTFTDNCAKGFGGKRSKPDFYIRFRTEQQMNEHITRYFESGLKVKAYKAERKAEQSKPHTLKVGDILSGSWGYDQTNVDFFQVVELKGVRQVIVRPIASQQIDQTAYMAGHVVPLKDRFIGSPTTHTVIRDRIKYDPCAKYQQEGEQHRFDRDCSASLWDGKPEYESSYA